MCFYCWLFTSPQIRPPHPLIHEDIQAEGVLTSTWVARSVLLSNLKLKNDSIMGRGEQASYLCCVSRDPHVILWGFTHIGNDYLLLICYSSRFAKVVERCLGKSSRSDAEIMKFWVGINRGRTEEDRNCRPIATASSSQRAEEDVIIYR